MLKLNRRHASLALLATLPFVACSKEEKKAGLVIAVQTDMSVPKDVDAVEIEVSTYGNVMFANKYEVGEGGLSIPATLTLLPPEDSSTPVTIRVISFQGNTTRTLRRVVTTVPDSREALLRMPIQWLCDGEVEEKSQGKFTSSCKTGSSCLAGSCTSDEVDVKDLPSFTKTGVFGAKNADGKLACFDTVACLANNVVIPSTALDLEDCTISLSAIEELAGSVGGGGSGEVDPPPADGGTDVPPEDAPRSDAASRKPGRGTLAEGDVDGGTSELSSPLNFAFSFPPGSDVGICGEDEAEAFGCFVPLDGDATAGWRIDGDVVHLPPGVCKKLTATPDGTQDPPPPLPTLIASQSCPTKAADTPPCGPWLQNFESYGAITVELPDGPTPGSGGATNGSGGGTSTGSGGSVIGSGGSGTGSGGSGGEVSPDYSSFFITPSDGSVYNDEPLFAGFFVPTSDGASEVISNFTGSNLCVSGAFSDDSNAYGGFMLNLEDVDQSLLGIRFAPGAGAPSFTRVSVQQAGNTYCREVPTGGGQAFLFAEFQQANEATGACNGAPLDLPDPSTFSNIQITFSNKSAAGLDFNVCLYELYGLYVPKIF